MLFIGTQFSNLYTAVDTPAKGRVCVCVVFVFACKYVLGHSRVSQPPNSGYASSGTLAFSLRRMPPRPAADAALTHTGSSATLHHSCSLRLTNPPEGVGLAVEGRVGQKNLWEFEKLQEDSKVLISDNRIN